MAIYIPPQGDEVNFPLGIYIPPTGDDCNFELLEALGTQIAVYESLLIEEAVSFYFSFNYHSIDVFEALPITEDVQLSRIPESFYVYDSKLIQESLSIYLDSLSPDIYESVLLIENATVRLNTLFVDVYDESLLEEYFEWIVVLSPLAVDEVLMVEDVSLLDLVIEIFDAGDDVSVSEYTEFLIFPPFIQSYEDAFLLDFAIIGLSEMPITFHQSINIHEQAEIAPFWYWIGEQYDDVVTEDIVDRILVGHFPLPTEDIAVLDEIFNIEVFPPFPFPVEAIGHTEWSFMSMTPPSLSWIAEYLNITERIVVGQDPHYADLGYQEIAITEDVSVSPNPLYVEVQDMGEIVPSVSEWAKADVGYPVYVSDDILAEDVVIELFIDGLMPFFMEDIGHDELFLIEVYPYGLWSAYDSIPLVEYLEIVLSVIPVDKYESLTLTEDYLCWVGQEIFPEDEIVLLDEALVLMEGLFPSRIEVIVISETVSLIIAPREFSESDEIEVSEDVLCDVVWVLNVYDSIVLSENFVWGLSTIPLSVYQDIVISEFADRAEELGIHVWQFIELNETVNCSAAILFVELYEDILVEESAEAVLALPLVISEDIIVAEYVDFFFTALSLHIYEDVLISEALIYETKDLLFVLDNVPVSEYVSFEFDLLLLSVNSSISAEENFDFKVGSYFSVGEGIGVSDFVYVGLSTVSMEASESISIYDIGWMEDLTRFLSAYDYLSISEYSDVIGILLSVSVEEEILTNEIATVYGNQFFLLLDEYLFHVESVSVQLESYLSVFSEIVTSEDVSIFMIHVTGGFDLVGIVEHVLLSPSPLPVAFEDSIATTENVLVAVTPLIVEVFDSISQSENISPIVNIDHYHDVNDEVLLTEYALMNIRISAFIFSAIELVEDVFIRFDLFDLFAEDSVTVTDEVETQHVFLIDVFENIPVSEITDIEQGDVLLFIVEEVFVEEYAEVLPTGIAVYPHQNIFSAEQVELSLDLLSVSVESSITAEEYFRGSDYFFGIELFFIEEYVSLAVDILYIGIQQEFSVEENVSALVFEAGTLPVSVHDAIETGEIPRQYLDQLWTGIQTDFIAAVDEMVDYLVGVLAEGLEDILAEESVALEISGLFLSVYEDSEIVDVGGAWKFTADTVDGFDFIIVKDVATVSIPIVPVETFDEVSVEEYVERIEGYNLSAIDWLDITEEYLEVFLPYLCIDELSQIAISEFLIFSGLHIRMSISELVSLSENVSLIDADVYLTVSETIAISEAILFWDIAVNVSDDVAITSDNVVGFFWGTSFTAVFITFDPKGIYPEEYVNISEWTDIQVQPIDLSIHDSLSIGEVVVLESSINVSVLQDVLSVEYFFAEVLPPYLITQQSISIFEYISLVFEPFEVNVYDNALIVDRGWSYISLGGQLNLVETITTVEDVSLHVTNTAWYLGVAENVQVAEDWIYGLSLVPLMAYDLMSIADIAILTDLVIELGPAVDLMSVSEAVWSRLNVLVVDRYDEYSISEYFAGNIAIRLSVYESSSLTEYLVRELYSFIHALDSISAFDVFSILLESQISVFDEVSLFESVNRHTEFYSVYVSEYVSASEILYLDILCNVFVLESVQASEILSVFFDNLFIYPEDFVSASEFTVQAKSPLLLVYEGISVVSEALVLLDALFFEAYNEIGLLSTVNLFVNVLYYQVTDEIAIYETVLSVLPVLNFQAWDLSLVSEWIEYLIPINSISLSELVSVTQNSYVNLGIEISLEELCSLAEDFSLIFDNWAIVEYENLFIEEDMDWKTSLLLQAVESIFSESAVSLDEQISILAQEYVLATESIYRLLNLVLFVYDSVLSSDSGTVVLRWLCINVNSLASIFCECYIESRLDVFIIDNIELYEWFVWGLPIQFIGVNDEIDINEEQGIYVEPFKIYPILFGSSKHGGW